MAGGQIAKLIAVDSSNSPEFTLGSEQTTIGSAPGNDLIIGDPTVSRRHARLIRNGANLELTDLGSTNGTYVNDHRINGTVVIGDGAAIRFGRAAYVVRIANPAASRGSGFRTAMTGALLLIIAGGVAEATLNWNQIEHATDIHTPAATSPIVQATATATTRDSHKPVAIASTEPLNATAGTAARTPVPEASAKPPKRPTRRNRPAPASAATAIPSIEVPYRRKIRAPLKQAVSAPIASPTGAASPSPDSNDEYISADVMTWLGQLNFYRTLAGLSAVKPDAAASRGDANHARYILENYGAVLKSGVNPGTALHQEDAANKWYTPEGSRAGAGSDLDFRVVPPGFEGAFSSHALDSWMGGPFHRLWILNPNLRTVGYGQNCVHGMCVAALDLLSGATHPRPDSGLLATPVEFPPDGSVLRYDRLPPEWPNPLTACSGYIAPAGLPITLQLGSYVDPKLTAYSFSTGTDKPAVLDSCGFDASGYINPDAMAQQRARHALQLFGAVIVVPRNPLKPGPYKVSITAGHTYEWSFTIAPPANG